MQDTLSGLEDFARNYMDDVLIASYTEKGTPGPHHTSFRMVLEIQNETETCKM